MSYLLDKKLKRNKFFKIAFFAIILFFLIYFRSPIFSGISVVAHTLFRPILILGNGIGNKFSDLGFFFSNKRALFIENEQLKIQINFSQAKIANYDLLSDENIKLKDILGRKKEKANMILANILSKPNQSFYDTLIIDLGSVQGIEEGDTVFAFGNTPIGYVSVVYSNSAKVVLFSSSGEKNEVVISGRGVFLEAVGRGGGNFEILLPRDFVLEKGTPITFPGANSYLLGVVETLISDPRDSFQKVLIVSPVNIQELNFVEVSI